MASVGGGAAASRAPPPNSFAPARTERGRRASRGQRAPARARRGPRSNARSPMPAQPRHRSRRARQSSAMSCRSPERARSPWSIIPRGLARRRCTSAGDAPARRRPLRPPCPRSVAGRRVSSAGRARRIGLLLQSPAMATLAPAVAARSPHPLRRGLDFSWSTLLLIVAINTGIAAVLWIDDPRPFWHPLLTVQVYGLVDRLLRQRGRAVGPPAADPHADRSPCAVGALIGRRAGHRAQGLFDRLRARARDVLRLQRGHRVGQRPADQPACST